MADSEWEGDKEMRNRLEDALKGHQADYLELRVEEVESTTLRYRGRELEEVGRSLSRGGSVRALIQGGWGFVSFNSLDDLRAYVSLAIAEARLAADGGSRLQEVEPVVDVVRADLAKDPRTVPLEQKKALLDEYNEALWASSPKIQTTVIRYHDVFRRKWLATSEGTYLEQERADITASFVAVAREGNDVQQAVLSLGSAEDYGILENLHEQVADVGCQAEALLAARPVKGGTYTVVVDPILAGVFVHEAFGHLSEADHVYENPRLQELMVLGKRFGPPELHIYDGAAIPHRRGSYKYDDEGVPAQVTPLVEGGVLVGRLHSRETAAKMGERVTGNARALSYRYRPLVRMTNTYIANGTVPKEDLFADIREGIYVIRSLGGQTDVEMFTFAAAQAFMIRDGRLAEQVRGVNLSGNLFETLMNIEAIGDDFQWGPEGGGCGKGGQSPLPVGTGSPHLRIRNVVVGGE